MKNNTNTLSAIINPIEISDRIRRLKSIKGRNAKIELLKEYLNDIAFLRVTQSALDSRKHYNISTIPEFEKTNVSVTMNEVLDYLDYLSTKRGCTDFEKLKLMNMACSDKYIYDITKMILSKSLDIGCAAKSINIARPNTVEIFPYMRCSKIDQIGKIRYPAIVQEKMNGEFINIVKHDGKISHRTRYGNYLDLKGRFFQQFMECTYDECVFMGEIIAVDENDNFLSRQTSNGIMTKAIEGTLTEDEADKFVIVLWDLVDYENFIDDDKATIFYKQRFDSLTMWIYGVHPHNVKLVEAEIVNSYEEAIEFFKHVVSRKIEGAVLKDHENLFKNTTSNLQIKLKPVKDADMRIIAWNYGDKDKKYRYCMGSLTLGSEDDEIICDCGSGFTDKDRGFLGFDNEGNVIVGMDSKQKQYWDSMVGKIYEIEFSEIGKDKKRPDKDSIYLPIGIRPRPDKDIADLAARIKSK